MLVIAVVVVVVIAVVIAGVYLAMSGGGGGGGGGGNGISTATSLQFSVDVSGGSSTGTYTYYVKNAGTANMMIRIEGSSAGTSFAYIVNGVQQMAWAYDGSNWTDVSSTFSSQWSSWNSTWTGYAKNLATWTSGDWTYTDPQGNSVRIYSISVNPSLADSLFQPPAS